MSKESKQKPMVPVIAEKEPQRILDVVLSVGSFRWDNQTFVNLQTGEKVKGKMWRLVGSASMYSVQKSGVKILEYYEGEDPNTGKMRNFTRVVGKVYGYEAIARSLSGIFPCSIEEAKRLVQQARERQIRHVLLVRKSDLVPTSPDRYLAENGWVMLAKYPDRDDIDKKVNETLKTSGSPLRVEIGLLRRIVE